ncbi:16S rRNA (guanine(527)-N(7))-methyltransferase RsmG [Alteriqipengyuania lutimaris]|uniref:Ribosomal RNA small subunit methyltransferase G n=1 Tax=Alteriqipengyuania lutimaris TaxID=1538146 RepID=A0A395LSV3_9SPHN|nr:16S rRNA (guanine(527)-N(7))-methyltransferase RsmG [Alteriqipengyuania lutimaris]RDS78514.1 16S rRNA (guanine(527)-N(7))-methyltransferase RsmG [Alteriqipengyuania lutimaris]
MIETEEQARAFVADLCSSDAFSALERFAAELLIEAAKQNLIARSTTDTLWQRHFADSAQLLDHVPRETDGADAHPWLDLGSGAGFPGIVMAIMRPEVPHVLVESRARRVEWLERMVALAGLKQCRVVHSRLEKVESFPAGVITARAFAPLPQLISLSARFSTTGTTWLLPKGRSAAQERDELDSPQRAMFHVKQSVTSRDAAILVGTGRPKTGSRT